MCSRVGWCVGMRRGDVVYGGFVGRRLRVNGERLCGCCKDMFLSSGGVVVFSIQKCG